MTGETGPAAAREVDSYDTGRAHTVRDRMTLLSPRQGGSIHVLGALLDEMPEATLLGGASTETLRVTHEPSRLAVLARLRSGHYDAVVFPVLDGRGLPTAPLIHQCALEHAGLALIAICYAPPARASALLAAARAGARVIVPPSVTELTSLLRDLSRQAVERVVVARGSLQGVEPPFLRDVLVVATETAGVNGRVATFAAALNVSTRTLSRQLRQAGLPSPRALLAAARLLVACAELDSFPGRDAAASARLSGVRARRLMRTARQYAVLVAGDHVHPSFPHFGDALAAVVTTLGGHLET